MPATGLGGLGLDGRALPVATGCLMGGALGLFGGDGLLGCGVELLLGFSISFLASSCLYAIPVLLSALSCLLRAGGGLFTPGELSKSPVSLRAGKSFTLSSGLLLFFGFK